MSGSVNQIRATYIVEGSSIEIEGEGGMKGPTASMISGNIIY